MDPYVPTKFLKIAVERVKMIAESDIFQTYQADGLISRAVGPPCCLQTSSLTYPTKYILLQSNINFKLKLKEK